MLSFQAAARGSLAIFSLKALGAPRPWPLPDQPPARRPWVSKPQQGPGHKKCGGILAASQKVISGYSNTRLCLICMHKIKSLHNSKKSITTTFGRVQLQSQNHGDREVVVEHRRESPITSYPACDPGHHDTDSEQTLHHKHAPGNYTRWGEETRNEGHCVHHRIHGQPGSRCADPG